METRALANEVYLKVFGSDSRDFGDRRHFYRLIGKAIRHLLINYAEERRAAKRGGGADHVPLEEAFGLGLSPKASDQARELHRALERLQAVDARAAEVVQLKFFVGLKNAEIGEVLEVSKATVARDWTFARAWLWREMGAESGAIGEVGPGPEPV